MNRRVIQPNVIRGGRAIPLGNNYYYMSGRKHSQGGIDIGRDLEVEGGEVMHMGGNTTKVFSSVRFLNGRSPAERVMRGENPNQVFAAQEKFKKVNRIKDDGTKARWGTKLSSKEEKEFQDWYQGVAKVRGLNRNPDAIGEDYDYRGYWKKHGNISQTIYSGGNGHFTDEFKTPNHPTFSNESRYSSPIFEGGSWTEDKSGRNVYIPSRYTKGRRKATHNYLKGTGEGYRYNGKTIFP